jgi:hypothetical protein
MGTMYRMILLMHIVHRKQESYESFSDCERLYLINCERIGNDMQKLSNSSLIGVLEKTRN